jgi:hypothetical protein
MAMQTKEIVETFLKQPSRVNSRGNTVHSASASTGRYVVDFADDYTSEGWEQFDTDQDAHYFGVWVNKGKLMTLTYAEGDWSLVVCPDLAHYRAEIENMIQFYGEGFIAKTYDEKEGWVEHRQDRSRFLPEVTGSAT